MYELPWDSVLFWYAAAIMVDFCYYWMHRASHGNDFKAYKTNKINEITQFSEIHIFWAQHQVHHSSEEFNVTVGVRQSVFQSLVGIVSKKTGEKRNKTKWFDTVTVLKFCQICYAPLAFFVPPVLLLVHQQLNLLYQIWIHTETITTLGPLDYVLNTPAYHRVHHG